MTQVLPTLSDDDCFLETKDAAKFIGVSPHTLATWRRKDRKKKGGIRKVDGPPYHPIGKTTVVYLKSELFAWVLNYRHINGVKIAPAKPGAQPRPWE